MKEGFGEGFIEIEEAQEKRRIEWEGEYLEAGKELEHEGATYWTQSQATRQVLLNRFGSIPEFRPSDINSGVGYIAIRRLLDNSRIEQVILDDATLEHYRTLPPCKL